MMYLGDFVEDATVYFEWSTNSQTGASVTRTADGTVQVYKDNASDTESVAGVTDTEDFDSLTGIHACTIDTSADAFYATGADYTVVLNGATIAGETVNAVLAHFSIENRFASTTLLTQVSDIQSDITNIMGAGFDTGSDSLVQIRDELSDIQSDIANIMGAGFDTGSDSLVQIHDDLASTRTELSDVQSDITNIMGAGFDTGSDSLVRIRTELSDVQSDLANAMGATFDTATDSLEGIRDRGDVAWATTNAHTFYVSKAGNNGSDGSSWDQAKLTISAMVAAASDGDIIRIGPGSYAEAFDASGTSLRFIGSGPATVITSDVTTTVELGGNSTLENLRVVNTDAAGASRTAVRVNAKDHVAIVNVEVTSVENGIWITNSEDVRLSKTSIYSAEYGLIIASSSKIETVLVEDCLIHTSGWTDCSSTAMDIAGFVDVHNSVIISNSPHAVTNNWAYGVSALATAQVNLYNTTVEAHGTNEADAAAVVAAFTGCINIIGGGTLTSVESGTATEYDLSNGGTGTLAVSGVQYDPTKTNGTITIVPPENEISDIQSDVTVLLAGVDLNLAQVISQTPTAETVGEAMLYSVAGAKYKLGIVGTTMTLYQSDATTVLIQWTLDDDQNPTSRTPV